MSLLPGEDLSRIPVMPPPPGISSTFVNPPTLAPAIVTVSIVMMVWALLFVITRLYANFHVPRGLAIDDYFCITATVLAVGYTGVVLSLKKVARHTYDVPLTWTSARISKLEYAQNLMIGFTLFFAKSTILTLYFRLFAIKKTIKRSVWFGLAWCFLLYVISVPVSMIFCAPRAGESWHSEAVGTRCERQIIYAIPISVLSLALDLYIFILPIPIVLRLQMSRKRRMSILGIFGTAFLGIIAAVVRMVYQIKLYTDNDPFWGAALTFICITVEMYIAIIVGSMPAFAAFFRGEMPGASLLASVNSLRSRNGAPNSKIGFSNRSNTGIPFSGESMILSGHSRDKGYLELHNPSHLRDYELGSVSSEIQGEAGPRTLEMGIVHRTIDVRQTMG